MPQNGVSDSDESQIEPPEIVAVDDLLLDRENPRLAAHDVTSASQEQILTLLWKEMEVDEVALSIARNGWFKHEHLLVIPDGQHRNKYIVIEGNRRLVAVKVLRDPVLRAELGGRAIEEAMEGRPEPPSVLPVVPFDDREELWQYVGFEHVNGAKPWDALSKAEYVWNVFDRYDKSLGEIAAAIGDTHSTVLRLFRGYAVLRQAEEDYQVWKRGRERQRDFFFSHLYTALSYQQFRDFLGIDEDGGMGAHPVPEDHADELQQVLWWLYGDREENIEPVIERQYPDLNDLREVVGSSEAVAVLEQTRDLEDAYVVAVGRSKIFIEAISDAENSLQYAQSLMSGVREEPELLAGMLERIRESVEIIEMRFSAQRSEGNEAQEEAAEEGE